MQKRTFTDGIHVITNDDYHASTGLSRSALWTFKRTPALYWHEYLNPDYVKPDQTPAHLFGDVVHTCILEPETFEFRYVVAPSVDRRTKQGKADWEAFLQESNGKTVITQDQSELAQKMKDRMNLNQTFNAILDGSKIEHSIFFTHERTGIQCKVRPDMWNGMIVGDLKTTESASPVDFQRSAYKYGYYLQAAMIHEALRTQGIKMEKFVFASIEKKEPFLEALYVLDQDALDFGINLFNKLMDEYAACLEQNYWPGYGIQALGIPAYAQFEE